VFPGSRLAIGWDNAERNGDLTRATGNVWSGFEFKASVVLDMLEVNKNKMDREIRFQMHDSRDFKEFSGKWALKSVNNDRDTLLR